MSGGMRATEATRPREARQAASFSEINQMRIKAFLISFFFALAALLIFDAFTVDSCLDSGGVWNFRKFSCEK